MPPGVPPPPRRIPRQRMTHKFTTGKPQHKITCITLMRIVCHPRARRILSFLNIFYRGRTEAFVARKGSHIKIHVPSCTVRVPTREQLLDKRDHILDTIAGITDNGRLFNTEQCSIAEKGCAIVRCNLQHRVAMRLCAPYQLILTTVCVTF